jgi:hypothetical protein
MLVMAEVKTDLVTQPAFDQAFAVEHLLEEAVKINYEESAE